MIFRIPIPSLLRRGRGVPGAQPSEQELRLLAPLGESLGAARPERGLLEEIEAELDAGQPRAAPPRPPRPAARLLIRAALAGALAGAGLAAGAVRVLDDRLPITLRAAPGERWLPLGAVSLQGTALQGFVDAKCAGRSHLVIALSAYGDAENMTRPGAEEPISATPVTGPDEKILMRCNF